MDAFDDIRSYRQADYQAAMSRLWNQPHFLSLLPRVPFVKDAAQLREQALSLPTLQAFQQAFIIPLLGQLSAIGTNNLSQDGLDKLDKSRGYLFISNHRDIIMDSIQLNHLLCGVGMEPSETAIGDNLLIQPWIADLVRLSKCFIVRRGLSIKEQMTASRQLSAYIRDSICQRGQSIWLAQREGRAKTSDDRTQKSIIKMLIMSGSGNILNDLASLNPVALSISYEYDPCDYLKAKELQLKRDRPDFHKKPEDDLLSMTTGIMGAKGRVHYHASPCLDKALLQLDGQLPRNELLEQVTALLDREIHAGYRLYPGNHAALELLSRLPGHEDLAVMAEKAPCPSEEKRLFEEYIERQVARIDLPDSEKDSGFLREKLLEMYANPLINYNKTTI
ncbi:MAG: 1-acyl-sn-glycerol-3-phosphate acyltransferase [Bacteroidales bacterium]|nr:1-acyl-sn-glycerol-3-phosphate acyltransferase [Bacteroidales bacterium]